MDRNTKISLVLSAVLIALISTNELQIVGMRGAMYERMGYDQMMTVTQAIPDESQAAITRIASQIIPRGIPVAQAHTGEVINYGGELGISFDTAAQDIALLSQLEQDTRKDKLTGDKLERYIAVGSQAACEYCCGVRDMVFPDGTKSCGCAHSAAMRGVAAYLIDNYGDKFTDAQIITEVNKFKATYFPRQTVQKAMAASVGGSVDASVLNQLAPQVGGC